MPLMSTVTLPLTLRHAARHPETTGIDLKVLVELHESLSLGEFKAVKPWHVAEMLRADIRSVQRALIHMEELGYLERGERNGNSYTFRLTMPANGDHSPPPLMGAA
jgi:hypothetical protein